MSDDLLGIYEIAELAKVSASAVANWRNRFPDFPEPIANLKSGPVFRQTDIRFWLARRQGGDAQLRTSFYEQLAAKRGDAPPLQECVRETVQRLRQQDTSARKPGMLLGRIQSGKTRAFLGIIAQSFDEGYDVAVILTKGTKSLASQTLSRVKEDFREFIAADQVLVFDIMNVPKLTPYELSRKLILVVKKEADNTKRLLDAFEQSYPELKAKKVLIIDDEADLASVSGRRGKDGVAAGRISQQIDRLRGLVANCDFLQVTATPYSLYLQPDDELVLNGSCLFKPKRPAFTILLPTHSKYAGGDQYFERSTDPDSAAYYLYREVPLAERDALKKEDGRRIRIDSVLTERNTAVLRDATMTFLVAGSIRRLQQSAARETPQKYSLLFHTEQTRSSHEWQERIAIAIGEALRDQAREDSPLFNTLLQAAYSDLRRSVNLEGTALPSLDQVKTSVVEALVGGQLMITKVNSETEVGKLLDEDGQLKLRTPFNIFIGGQILDRGITVKNLIAFYYGRNPKKAQQDTVLQHSRMYGARSAGDIAVTRFYAPQHIYRIMRKIHEFDAALREAFECGAHDRGVYFIQKDVSNGLVPCSPNKLLFSDVTSIRPGRRLLPVGFQTVSKTQGAKNLSKLDQAIDRLCGKDVVDPVSISVDQALDLLELAYANLEFEDLDDDDRTAHIAAVNYLSKMCKDPSMKGRVWLLVARDRNISRYREEGRFSNAPDTKQQADLALRKAKDVPVLMLLRQNGEDTKGWRGLPFWWPVVFVPSAAVTAVVAANYPTNPDEEPTGNIQP